VRTKAIAALRPDLGEVLSVPKIMDVIFRMDVIFFCRGAVNSERQCYFWSGEARDKVSMPGSVTKRQSIAADTVK